MLNNKIPSLPPLYFQGKVHEKEVNVEETPSLTNLPSELMKLVADYADWGDLAKLSAVQTSWKNLIDDAANYGGHASKWDLAEALLEGTNGLERNPARAIHLLKDLSGINDDNIEEFSCQPNKQPFAPAMSRLSQCYLTGKGVEKNTQAGVNWLKAAYEHSDCAESAHKLACMYEYAEHGVACDVYAAAEWFKKAAELDHIEGMAEYAMCCELGCGREQSDEEALEWYMKAANAGHVTAKFSVGEAFEEARGVPQSDEEACLWYYKAAVEGDEDSKKALRRLHDIARIVVPGVGGLLNV
jgi:TPR repeat protein